jgi:hypothetical protein
MIGEKIEETVLLQSLLERWNLDESSPARLKEVAHPDKKVVGVRDMLKDLASHNRVECSVECGKRRTF